MYKWVLIQNLKMGINDTLTEAKALEMIGPIQKIDMYNAGERAVPRKNSIFDVIAKNSDDGNYSFQMSDGVWDLEYGFSNDFALHKAIGELVEYMDSQENESGNDGSQDRSEIPPIMNLTHINDLLNTYARQNGFNVKDVFEDEDEVQDPSVSDTIGVAIRNSIYNAIKHNSDHVSLRIVGGEKALAAIITYEGQGYLPDVLSAKNENAMGKVRERLRAAGIESERKRTMYYSNSDIAEIGFEKTDDAFKVICLYMLPE